jgi:hypothetical protein
MTNRDLELIATRESARAILSNTLNAGSVQKISILRTGKALGFVQIKPSSDNEMVATTSEFENRITTLLGGRAFELVAGLDADSIQCSSAEFALLLAEQLADTEAPDWRINDPERATNIVRRCLDRATALVRDNEPRIREMAAILVEKGELSQSDIASL